MTYDVHLDYIYTCLQFMTSSSAVWKPCFLLLLFLRGYTFSLRCVYLASEIVLTRAKASVVVEVAVVVELRAGASWPSELLVLGAVVVEVLSTMLALLAME